MGTTPTVYVICDNNCKFEGMTKEQILTAIMQAVEGGEIKDVDTGFVSTIKTINGTPLKFFLGTQAQYDELAAADKVNLFAIITNDVTKDSLIEALETLQKDYTELYNGLTSGSFVAKKAEQDEHGNIIADTYAKKAELVSGYLIVANATYASNAATAVQANSAYNAGYAIKDDLGNVIADTYAKKSEARQYISSLSFSEIYNSSYSVANQPRLDISSEMLYGKASGDTLGISGLAAVKINSDDNAHEARFTALWNTSTHSASDVIFLLKSDAAGVLYLIIVDIGIDVNKKIFCSRAEFINLKDMSTGKVYSLKVAALNIYYK